jgi:hypothetical protein
MPSDWGEINTLWLRIRQALICRMPCSKVVSCYPILNCLEQQCGFKSIPSQALTFSIPCMLLSRLYILRLIHQELITQNCYCGMFKNHLCPPISPFSWIFEVKWNCSWIFGKSQHIVHFGHQSVHIFTEVILHQGDIGTWMDGAFFYIALMKPLHHGCVVVKKSHD